MGFISYVCFFAELGNAKKGKEVYVTIIATFSLSICAVNNIDELIFIHSRHRFLQGFGKGQWMVGATSANPFRIATWVIPVYSALNSDPAGFTSYEWSWYTLVYSFV